MVPLTFLLRLTPAGVYDEFPKGREAHLRGNSCLRALPQLESEYGARHPTANQKKKLPCGEWKWVTMHPRGVISMCRFWENMLTSRFLTRYLYPVFLA